MKSSASSSEVDEMSEGEEEGESEESGASGGSEDSDGSEQSANEEMAKGKSFKPEMLAKGLTFYRIVDELAKVLKVIPLLSLDH